MATKKKKITKAERVLRFIADETGYDHRGRSFSEIQRFCCEMNGFDYDEFEYEISYHPNVGAYEKRTLIDFEKIIEKVHAKKAEITKKEDGTEWWTHYYCGGVAAGLIVSKKKTSRRVYRGYYCDALSVLLNAWCRKNHLDRWECWHVPKSGFYSRLASDLAYRTKSLVRLQKERVKFINYFDSNGLSWREEI